MMSYFAPRRPTARGPRKVLFTVVAGLLLVAAACGGDDDSSSAADFNDADVSFTQKMIPHHEQAIEMAQLAPTRAGSAEVKDLAERIESAQDPEIATMKGWLEDWNEPESADQMDGHGDMESSDGMMSGDDMADLMDAEGPDFDRMFLEMMKEHHQGAVDMSRTAIADGKNADAKELAQTIIDAQTKEITEMDALLAKG